MKNTHNVLRAFVPAMLFFCSALHAQILYTYDLDESGAPGTYVTGITVSSLNQVNGLLTDASACGDGFNSKGWSLSTGSFSPLFTAVEFTITPSAGYEVTITEMTFTLRRANNGAQRMRFAYSIDGGATWTDQGVDISVPFVNCNTGTAFTWNMTDIVSTTPVIFRIYGWNANNATGVASVREGSVSGTVCSLLPWYADADGDGYGDPGVTASACTMPAGYVADNTDCDDSHNTVYPGATEICDGLDNDCDGLYDEDLFTATIYPADAAVTCKGIDFIFSTDECSGCTYQWFKNDNVILGATASTYGTTKPAYYSVQVTTPAGCFDVSDNVLLTTELNPNANIYNPNGLNLCAPSPGNNILIKVGYTATNSYQWYHNDAPYTGDGATSWRIYPTEVGDYYCSITSASGCNRITETRTVINSCRMDNDIENDVISVYPNPASSEFTIALTADATVSSGIVTITNTIGETVYMETIPMNNGELTRVINLNGAPSGIYFVKIVAGNKTYTNNIVMNK